MIKASVNKKPAPIENDTKGGSIGYNRLDMQVSQALHMAIELYPNLNYLLIMDHYDDITLFDDEAAPKVVSYYQMKTSEDTISIDTAISEKWLSKLYSHLSNVELIVKELGLITNTPLRVTVKIDGDGGKKHKKTSLYASEHTPFEEFDSTIVTKIQHDIAARFGIPSETVDLSKFVHMRTTLSIPKHREIVEQEVGNFLYSQYPKISIDSVKTIYRSMIELLTSRQRYELLDKNKPLAVVREKKGVSKNEFSRIIETAMMIAIPNFSKICRVYNYEGEDKRNAALEYTTMVEDFERKSDLFTALFLEVRGLCLRHPQSAGESPLSCSKRIFNSLSTRSLIYSETYISVLIACILINEGRRMQ